MDQLKAPPKHVVLCSGGGSCCPVVTVDEHTVTITGDPGQGEVTMTSAQFRAFTEKAKAGVFDD